MVSYKWIKCPNKKPIEIIISIGFLIIIKEGAFGGT